MHVSSSGALAAGDILSFRTLVSHESQLQLACSSFTGVSFAYCTRWLQPINCSRVCRGFRTTKKRGLGQSRIVLMAQVLGLCYTSISFAIWQACSWYSAW